jgi:hypothetical protein
VTKTLRLSSPRLDRTSSSFCGSEFGGVGLRSLAHEATSRAAQRPKAANEWFQRFRRWHSWGGLTLSVLIVCVGVTGILLNHKDLIFHGDAKRLTGALRSTTMMAGLPLDFDRALKAVRKQCGDVPLDKIELKDEDGRLVYKIGLGQGRELRVDTHTGRVFNKYGRSLSSGEPSTWQWEKIVNDLHTGKILGRTGKLLIDFTSLSLVALSLTGLYIWGFPLVRKRQKMRQREGHPRPANQ